MYSGPLLEVAESIFKYHDEIYAQRVILERAASTFTLKFKSYAELGLEIFLNFQTVTHSQADDWFYTFNTADIMSRHPYPEDPYLIGDNYFPINGGLFVKSHDTFLHVYPDYPLGAGMPDSHSFQLHMHRNPWADDDLGLDAYYGEYSPAEHSLILGFTELSTHKIWKEYLQSKEQPLVFFKGYGKTFTEDIEQAEKGNDKWEYMCEYELVQEDNCAYLSSVVVREEDMICRVINICDETVTPDFGSFKLLEELNTLGGTIMQRQIFKAKGVLEFPANMNSGKNFVQYPKCDKEGLIKPYHLNTYRIQRNS